MPSDLRRARLFTTIIPTQHRALSGIAADSPLDRSRINRKLLLAVKVVE